MNTPMTDVEAMRLLRDDDRKTRARSVLAEKGPPLWSRVLMAPASAGLGYLLMQFDGPASLKVALGLSIGLAVTATVELWIVRRRLDALTDLWMRGDRDAG